MIAHLATKGGWTRGEKRAIPADIHSFQLETCSSRASRKLRPKSATACMTIVSVSHPAERGTGIWGEKLKSK